ncbi:hypothetical protein QAD02_014175 [Eretmocerus hayati]|uniref:Uncharacterized protein n=1 Tax=Eretmocerus hayati TaxID=131215 RepID=A0ACC2P5J2_9HYME|nr:hypothetical protein QAD02_014175 [Eretmocerus hayati]
MRIESLLSKKSGTKDQRVQDAVHKSWSPKVALSSVGSPTVPKAIVDSTPITMDNPDYSLQFSALVLKRFPKLLPQRIVEKLAASRGYPVGRASLWGTRSSGLHPELVDLWCHSFC